MLIQNLKNVPKSNNKDNIKYKINDCSINIYREGKFNNVTMAEISIHSLESIANSITSLIREARDIGYQQAQEDIRRQLGLKE